LGKVTYGTRRNGHNLQKPDRVAARRGINKIAAPVAAECGTLAMQIQLNMKAENSLKSVKPSEELSACFAIAIRIFRLLHASNAKLAE
jgi:hypothetical protein